ncbi:MAG: ABC transporter substrate-binding protein [Hyphomicrobiaceae bacterium]
MRKRKDPAFVTTMWRSAALAAAIVVVFVGGIEAAAHADEQGEPPKRVVSINLCTDQLVVDLVARERIAGLSRLAADPVLSAVAGRVVGLKLLRGQAEEVLALKPDLVLTTAYSTPEVVALLRRVGVRVEVIDMARDLDGIRTAIRRVARAVGERARGERLIADFDRRIAAAAPRSTHRPTALAYQVNSLTAEPGGLMDAALSAAGFANVARVRPLGPAGRLPLETLIAHPPDLVVLANDPKQFRTVMADNLRHRAFRSLLARRRHVHVPMPLWLCGTPAIAGAIEELSRERASLMQASARGVGPAPSGEDAGGGSAFAR